MIDERGHAWSSAVCSSSSRPLRSPSTMRSLSRPSTVSARSFCDVVRGLPAGEDLQHLLQRVVAFRAAVEDQVLHDLHFLGRDQVQRLILLTCTIAPVMPALTAWSRKTQFSTCARRRVEAEADIGEAEDDLDIREFVPDHPDAFQRPLAELAVVLVAGGDGEGQRVDQQVGLRQAVLVAGEIHQPPRDRAACPRRSSPCRLRRWSARSPQRRICWRASAGRRPPARHPRN